MEARKSSRILASRILAKQVSTISQIFPKTGRISGPEVGDGAISDVPTTDRQNEKKKNTVHFMKRSTRMRVAA